MSRNVLVLPFSTSWICPACSTTKSRLGSCGAEVTKVGHSNVPTYWSESALAIAGAANAAAATIGMTIRRNLTKTLPVGEVTGTGRANISRPGTAGAGGHGSRVDVSLWSGAERLRVREHALDVVVDVFAAGRRVFTAAARALVPVSAESRVVERPAVQDVVPLVGGEEVYAPAARLVA